MKRPLSERTQIRIAVFLTRILCINATLMVAAPISAQDSISDQSHLHQVDHTHAEGHVCTICDSAFTDSVGQGRIDIEFGSRRPVIDILGWIIGIPDKLMMWDQRAKNHRVSQRTVQSVGEYLQYANLGDVKVRANQYDPIGEWQRLVANKRVGAGWKYTAGLMRHVEYTVLPGRLFGRDEYNPYTNSLYLYSDMPSLALAESAYAMDVREREYPGTYATVQTLPLVSIWHETLATKEVMNYIAIRGNPQQRRQIRRDLYARFGISIGGEMGRVLPDGSELFAITGAVAGHTAATIKNRQQLLR